MSARVRERGQCVCTLTFRAFHTYLQDSESPRLGGRRSRCFWALLCDLGLLTASLSLYHLLHQVSREVVQLLDP